MESDYIRIKLWLSISILINIILHEYDIKNIVKILLKDKNKKIKIKFSIFSYCY